MYRQQPLLQDLPKNHTLPMTGRLDIFRHLHCCVLRLAPDALLKLVNTLHPFEASENQKAKDRAATE